MELTCKEFIAIFVKSMTYQERCGDHSITIPNG